MQPISRTMLRSAPRLRLQARLQQQQRRHAGDSHGTGKQPVNESFGRGFFITLAAIPVCIAVYQFTSQGTGEQPFFTRIIRDTYADYAGKWATRNDSHTRAMEQAAADKVLFLNEANQNVRTVDLRFPEQFNQGSPWSVPAGQGGINIDRVIAKYQKEAYEQNERQLQEIRENRVPAEQPIEPLTKLSPATPGA